MAGFHITICDDPAFVPSRILSLVHYFLLQPFRSRPDLPHGWFTSCFSLTHYISSAHLSRGLHTYASDYSIMRCSLSFPIRPLISSVSLRAAKPIKHGRLQHRRICFPYHLPISVGPINKRTLILPTLLALPTAASFCRHPT